MKNSTVAGIALIAALSGSLSAKANMLVNGGLEVMPGQIKANKTLISSDHLIHATPKVHPHVLAGWTVGGAVDVVSKSVWADTEGNYSVDLVGSPGLGSISQTVFGLTPGTTYDLSFDFSVNPAVMEAGLAKWMDVTITNSDVPNTIISSARGIRTVKHMQYVHRDIDFTATSTKATISFAEFFPKSEPKILHGSPVFARNIFTGMVLDNIDLESVASGGGSGLGGDGGGDGGSGLPTPTPEPASLAVLGLGGAMLLRRRR